jgi:hypothetical protein
MLFIRFVVAHAAVATSQQQRLICQNRLPIQPNPFAVHAGATLQCKVLRPSFAPAIKNQTNIL